MDFGGKGGEMFEVPVEIFPMNEHDLTLVAALEAEAQDFPWSRDHFADSLRAGYSCWVCSVGGSLAGFSVVMHVLDEAHLLNLAVGRSYRGRGYGARLLQTAVEVARENRAQSMFLEVRASNRRALDLYRNYGFREIAQRRDYYPAAMGREDALVLEKEFE